VLLRSAYLNGLGLWRSTQSLTASDMLPPRNHAASDATQEYFLRVSSRAAPRCSLRVRSTKRRSHFVMFSEPHQDESFFDRSETAFFASVTS